MPKTLVCYIFLIGTAMCWLFGAITLFNATPTMMTAQEREAYLNSLVARQITNRDAYGKKFFDANPAGIALGMGFIAGGFLIFGLGQIWLQLSRLPLLEERGQNLPRHQDGVAPLVVEPDQ